MREMFRFLLGDNRKERGIVSDAEVIEKELDGPIHQETIGLSLEPVEKIKVDELTLKQRLDLASEMRGLLIDYFEMGFIDTGSRRDGRHLRRLKRRARDVTSKDDFDLVGMVKDDLNTSGEEMFPIHASYVKWDDDRQGIIILAVGFDEEMFISIFVAPYIFFDNEERAHDISGSTFPIYERRWRRMWEESIQSGLEVALSGDLEGLSSLGFVDREETAPLEFDGRLVYGAKELTR